MFLNYIKYPRTYHLPTSPNLQNDDRQHQNVDFFIEKTVVGTIKMDGESCSMYHDYIHARSIDSKNHPSRNWVKALHGRIAHDIPEGWRICGENLYAKHSIHYHHLNDYFQVINIWNKNNICLDWASTLEWTKLLDLKTTTPFYTGMWNQDAIQEAFESYCDKSEDKVEGYVVRVLKPFPYKDYKICTAKWVRKNHVTTSKFWMTQPVIPNVLKER